MKKIFSVVLAIALFSVSTTAVFASEPGVPSGQEVLGARIISFNGQSTIPCPPGASCSEDYMITDAKISAAPVEKPEVKKVKRIELRTFSEIRRLSPTGALYAAHKKALEWIDKQNPETVINVSETAACYASKYCDAFVTVTYWRMTSPTTIKEEVIKEEGK